MILPSLTEHCFSKYPCTVKLRKPIRNYRHIIQDTVDDDEIFPTQDALDTFNSFDNPTNRIDQDRYDIPPSSLQQQNNEIPSRYSGFQNLVGQPKRYTDDSENTYSPSSFQAPNLIISILFWCIMVIIFLSICISRVDKRHSREDLTRHTSSSTNTSGGSRRDRFMGGRDREMSVVEPLPVYIVDDARIIDLAGECDTYGNGWDEEVCGGSVYTASHFRLSVLTVPPLYKKD